MPPCGPCVSRIHAFERVEHGATLEVWIEGDCNAFTSSLQLQADVEPPGLQKIAHGQLCRAPGAATTFVEPLATPRLYVATVFVTITAAAATTVALNMRILKADGVTTHSQALCCTYTGQQGDSEYLTAFIKTYQN